MNENNTEVTGKNMNITEEKKLSRPPAEHTVIKNRKIRLVALLLHLVAMLMYFVVPLLLGGSVSGILWAVAGVLHSALFAFSFFRDHKKRRLVPALGAIINIVMAAGLGILLIEPIVGMAMPVPAHMLIFTICSLAAMILTCTSLRKYVRTGNAEESPAVSSDKPMRFVFRHKALVLCAGACLLAILNLAVGSAQSRVRGDDVFSQANFLTAAQPSVRLSSDAPYGKVAGEYLEFMHYNVRDRFAFSYQELDAAVWLVEELLAMGYSWDDIDVQAFTLEEATAALVGTSIGVLFPVSMMDLYYGLNTSPFLNLDLRSSEMSQNVILTVPGASNETIVVGGHYDAPMGAATSDNASGVALLLESAQRLQNANQYYTVVYVFFGAEEVGLLGSCYYMATLAESEHEKVKFAINADILLEGDGLFVARGQYADDSELSENAITERWDELAQAINDEYDKIELLPWLNGVVTTSDNLAFLEYNHTTAFLMGLNIEHIGDEWRHIERDQYGVVLPLDYGLGNVLHTPDDNFLYISENRPDMMDTNMMAFSLFLERALLAEYD